ncbi:DUF3108 domain-containing protein [Oxalobacteraceae bacterium R-40]|uniref:DUF3108 domain-containing protein n=1 Tax=Keguizhuia sedimenti TaxID=3064264 RepID=A0ABU1BJ84_9BURK|nr:DUF3108 domain-containing protein [Oxalobacteraceae bacterium R-40]
MLRFLTAIIFSISFTSSVLAAPAKYKTNAPPSADLHYSIHAVQKGIAIKGNGLVQWRNTKGSYLATAEIRAMLLGKILEEKSEGKFDAYGLAPLSFSEKRMRKSPVTVTFNRDVKRIQFSATDQPQPINGGEQDRHSITWQLASVARGMSAKFKSGSQWTFLVAGRKDVQAWTFKVAQQEKTKTPMGEINTMRIVRLAQDPKDQKIEIWLAPSLGWYPVKMRIAESDGDYVEQTLESITKK